MVCPMSEAKNGRQTTASIAANVKADNTSKKTLAIYLYMSFNRVIPMIL